MAVPMARRAIPGLLAALLFITTGAAPPAPATSSPQWSTGARSTGAAHPASVTYGKPRLPIRRTSPNRLKTTTGRLLIPAAPGSLNAVYNGLNASGLSAADNAALQVSPPDTTGSIGPNYYVEFINAVIGVYNRSDLSLANEATFYAWLGVSSSGSTPLCDPQIQWDPSSQRWLYEVLECMPGNDMFLFGWSKTPDPSNLVSGWCKFSVSTPGVISDYPKLGHSSKYMLVGANDYSDSGMNPFVTAQITWMRTPNPGVTTCTAPAVNHAGSATTPLMNGDGATPTFTPVPVNTSTNAANGYVVSAYDPFSLGPINKLAVFHLDSLGVLHADNDLTVNTYTVPNPAPDAGGSIVGIDTLDGRLTQAVGDPTTGIYTQHTVNGPFGRSKVTWYEIKVVSSVPTLVQEGDITNSTDFVYNAAISPRGDGQGAVIFYNRSNSGTDPVVATQGRMNWTAPGQMDPGEIVLALSTAGDQDFSCNFTGHGEPCRWGDYSGASPDPLNANVVWGSNQALTTPSGPGNPNWVTENFAIAGPVVSRVSAIQSSPVPTPTRDPATTGPTPAPPGSR
jgi:hypothetical protein